MKGDDYYELMCTIMGRRARDMVGKVAEFGFDGSDSAHQTLIPQSYKLPDGKEVDIGVERYEPGEMLFGRSCEERSALADDDPNLSLGPIQNLVCDSVFKCERDQQAGLLSTVVVAGGGSCTEGLPDRLRSEVENIVHTHTPGWRVKVLAPQHPERRVADWLGGSILASLGSFGENWVTKKEYDEHGAGIVARKCP